MKTTQKHLVIVEPFNNDYCLMAGGGLTNELKEYFGKGDIIEDDTAYHGKNALHQVFKVARWVIVEIIQKLITDGFEVTDTRTQKYVYLDNQKHINPEYAASLKGQSIFAN